MNWTILILFGIAAIVLVVFLVVRNRKDQKNVEHDLNQDYPKTKDEENEMGVDEVTK